MWLQDVLDYAPCSCHAHAYMATFCFLGFACTFGSLEGLGVLKRGVCIKYVVGLTAIGCD